VHGGEIFLAGLAMVIISRHGFSPIGGRNTKN
jgi:hypothetical protein